MNIKDILLDLVAVQSDTGTAMERPMADKIAAYFEADEYFKENRDCMGKDSFGDHLGRTTVWALKRGKTPRTIVLMGHYDAVEIECYGELKPFALKPELLREEILKREENLKRGSRGKAGEKLVSDIESGKWLVGRGTADMKGGLAVGIHKVLSHPAGSEAGILFMAVCDEENMSAGARAATGTLLRLREKFGLEYQSVIILEPQLLLGGEPEGFVIYNGSIGKLLPTIVTKGVLSHCGEPVKGLNAAHLAAEIAARIDLNCDFATEDLGLSTQAPIVQMVRDLKTTYDVSLPEYAALTVNLLFLGADKVPGLMDKIEELCREAAGAVMKKYEAAYEYSHSRGLIAADEKVAKKPIVVKLSQLEKMAAEKMAAETMAVEAVAGETMAAGSGAEAASPAEADFADFKEKIGEELKAQINSGRMTLQTASVEYIKRIIEVSGYEGPMIVVGIAPPYYPSVCNEYLSCSEAESSLSGNRQNTNSAERQIEKVRQVVEERYNMKLKVMPYFTGIGDASYMSCTDSQREKNLMANLTLPESCYKIPFDEISRLNAPCMYIGPRCYEIHQWSERVYMPDLEEVVPRIIEELLV